MSSQAKAEVYTRYPLSSILLYHGTTILHFLLGGLGIVLGYGPWIGYLVGAIYLVFAFGQMYVLMPLTVCPNCVYYRMENARCISGKNLLSRKVAVEGNPQDFAKRGKGLLCHNNFYMTALIGPIILIIPALFLNFSLWSLATWVALVGLLLFRFFVIFGSVACLHCSAKYECPNAERTGVRDR